MRRQWRKRSPGHEDRRPSHWPQARRDATGNLLRSPGSTEAGAEMRCGRHAESRGQTSPGNREKAEELVIERGKPPCRASDTPPGHSAAIIVVVIRIVVITIVIRP